MKIRFDYMNGKGERSLRIVHNIKVKNYALIEGFCELRQAERTFYVGGMSNSFDLEKNEPIDDLLFFLGITNKDGEIKKKYLKDDDY